MKCPIVLDPTTHTYTNIDTGEFYLSVSSLIGQFKKEFDKDGVSKRVAKNAGVDQQVVLDLWDQIKDTACVNGTDHHTVMEEYSKNGIVAPGFECLINSYNKIIAPITNDSSIIYSEKLVYSLEHKVAGTSDLIIDNGSVFYVLDFKTNKKFNFISKYRDYFKSPISYLQQCEFTTYSLQLSIYAYMYEQLTKKRCGGIKILYKRNLFDLLSQHIPEISANAAKKLDKSYWEEINGIYMKPAVEDIFNVRLKKLKTVS